MVLGFYSVYLNCSEYPAVDHSAYGILNCMMGGFYTKKIPTKSYQASAKTSDGFTIVEALIVLAVTGVLFVSIIGVVSGKQSKAQFTQGINSIRDEIEQVINEVQSGYYPEIDTTQGTNQEYMTIGKVIQFGVPSGSNPERYSVYSIVASRAIREVSSDTPLQVIDAATQVNSLKYGLTTEWVNVGGTGVSSKAIGILTYFSPSSAEPGSEFGSQTTQIVPVTTGAGDIGSGLAASYAGRNPESGVEICFNGNNGQSGLVTIGGNKQSNSVTLSIRNGNACEEL